VSCTWVTLMSLDVAHQAKPAVVAARSRRRASRTKARRRQAGR